jgi:hypothetical protein
VAATMANSGQGVSSEHRSGHGTIVTHRGRVGTLIDAGITLNSARSNCPWYHNIAGSSPFLVVALNSLLGSRRREFESPQPDLLAGALCVGVHPTVLSLRGRSGATEAHHVRGGHGLRRFERHLVRATTQGRNRCSAARSVAEITIT